jgi:hypothetical protein
VDGIFLSKSGGRRALPETNLRKIIGHPNNGT